MGIDPGKNGGAGVLDAGGAYRDAWRWKEKDPLYIYNKLIAYKGYVGMVLIERVNLFRQLKVEQILRMVPMVANSAAWETMLLTLGMQFKKVMPRIWQKALGLDGWKQSRRRFTNVKGKELLLTPYNLAKHLWPDAPLKTQADDGMAVGLLLAEYARQEHFLKKRVAVR